MRGLNKSSTQLPEQPASNASETSSSDQQQNPDENGKGFLVHLFEKTFDKGSNLMFGNDAS